MMKKTALLLIGISLFLIFSACQLGRFVFYNFADIKDYKKFPSRTLRNDSAKFSFNKTDKAHFPKTFASGSTNKIGFEQFLIQNNTVAFLIIRNDTLHYEKYFRGYDSADIVPSFSMAKAITSILIGCAIDDGSIRSVEEPITNYIPELKKQGFEKVTIKHLLQMTSGIKFNESYINPFGDAASFYYGRQLRKSMSRMKLKTEPGKTFKYISGNTQLLGLVLERCLKGKTITQYLQEKIWCQIGMEYEASWSIDKKKNGIEKTFCCVNARARDFAKIGRLFLNEGNWNGKQVVSKKWVYESTHIDTTEGGARFYKYQWWIPTKNVDFMAEGILGQFVYVHPSKKLIIVRLGKNEGRVDWWQVFTSLAHFY